MKERLEVTMARAGAANRSRSGLWLVLGTSLVSVTLAPLSGLLLAPAAAAQVPTAPGDPACRSTGYECTPGYTGTNAMYPVNGLTWAWAHYGGASIAWTSSGYHNCTLYVAWRLEQLGYRTPVTWGRCGVGYKVRQCDAPGPQRNSRLDRLVRRRQGRSRRLGPRYKCRLGAPPGGQFSRQRRARVHDGHVGQGRHSSSVPPSYPPVGPPIALSVARVGEQQVLLQWKAPAVTSGAALSGYEVEARQVEAGGMTRTPTGTPYLSTCL